MMHLHRRRPFQIRNRPRDPANLVISASTQAKFRHRLTQHRLRIFLRGSSSQTGSKESAFLFPTLFFISSLLFRDALHSPIEIGILLQLDLASVGLVLLKRGDRSPPGDLLRDRTGIVQDLALVELEERIKPFRPIGHMHRSVTSRLILCIVQVHRDNAVQFGNLLLGQVVLRNVNIRLANRAAGGVLPGGEPHIGLVGINPIADDLRGRLAVDGVMQLVCTVAKKSRAAG